MATVAVSAACLLGSGTLAATPATAEDTPASPLAGQMGVYHGPQMPETEAWRKAKGEKKELLGEIARQPRLKWFGSWLNRKEIGPAIHKYVDASQKGDESVAVQMAIFRLWPEGEGAKKKPLTKQDQHAYRRWVDRAAEAIGDTRTTMVLEPDLGVAYTGWRPQVRFNLARYAAEKFGSLKNTTVYIDGSDSDWLPVEKATDMLMASGIEYTRGFALGATHYTGVYWQRQYGKKLVASLADRGVKDRHWVLDTADNAQPFTRNEYFDEHPGGDYDNAEVCADKSDTSCITLGRRPQADGNAESPEDGWLWFGRPWLYRQASPYREDRALQAVRTSPYSG